ncbi:hypothetical protein FAM14222_000486 [Propionibacterium freudenreichii]|uniref:hypothetical protein n=1 Tax=Propionibacterium freudenreichii TaxID=1744 RepID=UPI00254D8740|nr:hypothetical protein [Propionibacterium freudenreichii]MDK9592240.1 hypothetical protein [Propionibacterium freudenreichii]
MAAACLPLDDGEIDAGVASCIGHGRGDHIQRARAPGHRLSTSDFNKIQAQAMVTGTMGEALARVIVSQAYADEQKLQVGGTLESVTPPPWRR